MENFLHLPDYAGEILCVSVAADADDFAFDGMIQTNQASFDWVEGRLDTGTYFEVLDHYGIDPLTFVQPIEQLLHLQ